MSSSVTRYAAGRHPEMQGSEIPEGGTPTYRLNPAYFRARRLQANTRFLMWRHRIWVGR